MKYLKCQTVPIANCDCAKGKQYEQWIGDSCSNNLCLNAQQHHSLKQINLFSKETQ